MKAVVCKAFGNIDDLVIEDVEPRKVGPNEVRIKVHAAGVNFPDILIVQGKYQVTPPLPFTPGPESAGEVLEVGANVTTVAPGDRVMATHPWGGYAEEVVASAATVHKLLDGIDYATGAGMQITYGTTYHALFDRGQIQPGETLLVTGASGGVGLSAVEVGKAAGARVIAAASSDDKLAVAKKYGADELINYSTEDLRERMKEITGGAGADVIYDPVGGDIFDQAVRCTAWGGRFLIIGFASGRIPDFKINYALIKSFSLVGVFWGSFAARNPEKNRENFRTLMQWCVDGKIKPYVSQAYDLDHAVDAMRAIAERKATGKLVITP